MRELTYSQLVEAKACHEQLALFRERYGDLVVFTVEAAREATQLFDWDWAARNLLSPAALAEYCAAVAPAWGAFDAAVDSAHVAFSAAVAPAWDAYNTALDSAWKAFSAAVDPAWEAYRAARDSAGEAYHAVADPILKEYDVAITSAKATLKAAQAEAFALAYIGDNPH